MVKSKGSKAKQNPQNTSKKMEVVVVPKKNPKMKQPRVQKHARLSPQTEDWVKAVENPFDCIEPPFIPTYPARASRKVKTFARGTMSTSATTGFGALVVTPTAAAATDCGIYTNNLYTGTTIPALTGTGAIAFQANCDYSAGSFNANTGVSARLVAMGIRIRYSGTNLNKGGTCYALEHPNHGDLGGLNIAQLMAYESCARVPVTENKWTNLVYHFLDASDFNYLATGFGSTVNSHAICVQAPVPTTSISFDWEYVGFWEYIGVNVRGKSPSFSDIVGLEMAVNAASLEMTSASQESAHIGLDGHANSHYQSVIGRILEVGSATLSSIDWTSVASKGYAAYRSYQSVRNQAQRMRIMN